MSKPNEEKFLDKEGRLEQWPTSRKEKLLVLSYLASKFDENKIYTEPELNDVIKQWHTFNDWPLLRRELVDNGFLNRTTNGSEYRIAFIETDDPNVKLAKPSVSRDAATSVKWLDGTEGRKTLTLMGNTPQNNQASDMDKETERIRDFITSDTQITWAILYQSSTVGAIWIELVPTEYLKAPAIHMMLGDSAIRGKGVGFAATKAILKYLIEQGKEIVFSRHLTTNEGATRLLVKAGFVDDGAPYKDKDGLEWQNVKLLTK